MPVTLPPPVLSAIREHAREPDLQEVLVQAAGAMRYLMDKVCAHVEQPTRYPLPSDPRSLEQRILSRVRRLPAATRNAAASSAMGRLRASSADREDTYGYAATILDPHRPEVAIAKLSASPVPSALRATGERVALRATAPQPTTGASQPPIKRPTNVGTRRTAASATVRHAPDPNDHDAEPDLPDTGADPAPPGGPAPTFVPQRLRLTVKQVSAVNKTNEIGRDEIAIAAVVMDPINQKTFRTGPIQLGKFGKGDRRSPGTVIADLPLMGNALLGQFFLANVFLAERDHGGFADYVDENEQVLSHEIGESLVLAGLGVVGAIVGGNIGSTLGVGLFLAIEAGVMGPIGAATIGIMGAIVTTVGLALVGAVAALLLGYFLITIAGDEIFTPASVGQSVEPSGRLLLAREAPIVFTRPHARYDVVLRWEVLVGAGTPAPPLPPAVGRIAEVAPGVADLNLRNKVDHVVVLMLENRSFDHMLGYLSLVGNRPDVHGLDRTHHNFNLTVAPPTLHRPRPLPDSTFLEDPPHSVNAVAEQISGGAMSGFVTRFAPLNPRDPGKIMDFHPAEQVPVYDFIAREFLICDAFHSSFAGNTWVNRTIALAGRPATRPADNFLGFEFVTNNAMPALTGAGTPSFFRKIDEFNDSLRSGEQRVNWRFYSQDVPTLPIVDPHYTVEALNPASNRFRSMNGFFEDLASGNLPQVSWLDPNFMDVGALKDTAFAPDDEVAFPGSPHTANDDHPPVDIAHGQAMIASILFAMMSSPVWEKLLFVIVYDEHGGFFDHVPPPKLVDLGLTPETNEFATLGCRVPALVVSPWVERGAVSDHLFDHCSVIKTILHRFCLRDGAIPFVSERVAGADHLGFVLTSARARFTTTNPTRSLVPSSEARRSEMPPRFRNELLRGLGKRLIVAAARDRHARPPTDMEKDVIAARRFFRAPTTATAPR